MLHVQLYAVGQNQLNSKPKKERKKERKKESEREREGRASFTLQNSFFLFSNAHKKCLIFRSKVPRNETPELDCADLRLAGIGWMWLPSAAIKWIGRTTPPPRPVALSISLTPSKKKKKKKTLSVRCLFVVFCCPSPSVRSLRPTPSLF